MGLRRLDPVLGELVRHERYDGLWRSSPLPVPLFDGAPIGFEFEDLSGDGPLPLELSAVVAAFLRLTTADRAAMTLPIWQNYQEILEAAGDDAKVDAAGPEDIWRFIWPTHGAALRSISAADKNVYVRITCGCGWEPEHGLQLVFRAGCELSRVSEYDGHVTEEDASGATTA